jgi:hypothetical protein
MWDDIGDIKLPHGYCLADLDRMTRQAVFYARWTTGSTTVDRYDVARCSIIDRLYDDAQERPSERELTMIGKRAVCRYVDDEYQVHGVNPKEWRDGITRGRFVAFWLDWIQHSGSHDTHVIEILAVRQIWPRLTWRNRRLLLALAVHGDYESAAKAVGMSRDAFIGKLSLARKQFLRYWHEGEQPSRIWGRDHKGIESYTPPQSIITLTVRQRKAARERREARGTSRKVDQAMTVRSGSGAYGPPGS